jgi:2'-hydroxyisoflavone reductase
MQRRSFLATTLAAAAAGFVEPASTLRAATSSSSGATVPLRAAVPLSILILGGTGFIGPHMVRYAVERGHRVTTFTRGRRQPWLFDTVFQHVEELHGDRTQPGGLEALRGRKWDVVIDNSGSRVEWTRDSAALLKDSVRNYVYVSSTGVFLPYRQPDIDESVDPVLADDPPLESPSFGVMKALSEREVQRAFGDRAIIVRPHYIVGPGDTTYRFPFWPARLQRGGEVLAPGRRSDPVQFIDVRDLTEWMIRDLVEGQLTGVYNAAGPRQHLTMEEFLYGAHSVFSSDVEWVWIDDFEFLRSYPLRTAADGRTTGLQAVVPWVLLHGDNQYMTSILSHRAVGSGLRWRPLAETVRAAIEWWQHEAPAAWTAAAGQRFPYTPEQEAAMIAAWRGRASG